MSWGGSGFNFKCLEKAEEHTDRSVEFRTTHTHLEMIIKWCYRKPYFIVQVVTVYCDSYICIACCLSQTAFTSMCSRHISQTEVDMKYGGRILYSCLVSRHIIIPRIVTASYPRARTVTRTFYSKMTVDF